MWPWKRSPYPCFFRRLLQLNILMLSATSCMTKIYYKIQEQLTLYVSPSSLITSSLLWTIWQHNKFLGFFPWVHIQTERILIVRPICIKNKVETIDNSVGSMFDLVALLTILFYNTLRPNRYNVKVIHRSKHIADFYICFLTLHNRYFSAREKYFCRSRILLLIRDVMIFHHQN